MFLFSFIKKQSYKVESYEISIYTKNLKTNLHLLVNNTIYIYYKSFKNDHVIVLWNALQVTEKVPENSKVPEKFSFN